MIQIPSLPESDRALWAKVDFVRALGESMNLVRRKDNQQHYAMLEVTRARPFALSPVGKELRHPFIAHLAFVDEIFGITYLSSPSVSGGHLFYRLQKVRQFDLDACRFYAAEITSALEYLHSLGLCCWLKAGNVKLDSTGHVKLCGFGIFQERDGAQRDCKSAEYPSPELLVNNQYSMAADYWTLGVLLCEMLTGLPPFYSDNQEDIRSNIISRPLHLPESMDPTAKDIINHLLHRDPGQRLGARGVCEIKQHAFFDGLNWQDLVERKAKPPFQSDYGVGRLQSYGVNYPYDGSIFGYNHPPQYGAFMGWHFHHLNCELDKENPKMPALTDEYDKLDTEAQIRAALEAALKSDREDLVERLFASKKVEPSTPVFEHSGRDCNTVLAWSVRHGSPKMLKCILPRTDVKSRDRVIATKALELAARMQNIPAATILLSHGTRCDFEDADVPFPDPAEYDPENGCTWHIPLQEDFRPPLLSAVLNNDAELTRMLLTHGAKPTLSYHDLGSAPRGLASFSCGWIVQLAMELELIEIVKLLLEHGANIVLPTPVWSMPRHKCRVVPRPVYQRVTAALRDISSKGLAD